MIQLCFLMELLGYCTLGLLPALIGFWADTDTPIATGIGCFVSYHLMANFTTQQLFWVYAIAGLIWWVCSWYCEYDNTVKTLQSRGYLGAPSFRSWCVMRILTAFMHFDVLRPARDEREFLVLDTILKAATWYASKREPSPVYLDAKGTESKGQRCTCLQSAMALQTPPSSSNGDEEDGPGNSQSTEFPDNQIWSMPDASTRSRDHMEEASSPQPKEQPSPQHSQ
jgi:hypothetical protein